MHAYFHLIINQLLNNTENELVSLHECTVMYKYGKVKYAESTSPDFLSSQVQVVTVNAEYLYANCCQDTTQIILISQKIIQRIECFRLCL